MGKLWENKRKHCTVTKTHFTFIHCHSWQTGLSTCTDQVHWYRWGSFMTENQGQSHWWRCSEQPYLSPVATFGFSVDTSNSLATTRFNVTWPWRRNSKLFQHWINHKSSCGSWAITAPHAGMGCWFKGRDNCGMTMIIRKSSSLYS